LASVTSGLRDAHASLQQRMRSDASVALRKNSGVLRDRPTPSRPPSLVESPGGQAAEQFDIGHLAPGNREIGNGHRLLIRPCTFVDGFVKEATLNRCRLSSI